MTRNVIFLSYAIVADELGGNVSQKGDGHVGREKFLCEKGLARRKVTSNQEKHFTLLGFTELVGGTVMHCIMFSGAEQNPAVKTDIDFTKPFIRDVEDPHFFEMICGDYKLLSGGPTLYFRGKDVPCFVRQSEKGGVSSAILTEILK